MLRSREKRALKQVKFSPGDKVIDVGANVGGASELLAAKGAHVYAFEPQPTVFDQLHAKFAGNDHVDCIQAAAWTFDGEVELFCHPTKTEAASVYEGKQNVLRECKIIVRSMDLAKFVRDNAPIKLLYVNAEGSEYELIIHLIDSGALDCIEHVILSPHSHKIAGIEDVVERAKQAAASKGIALK